MSRKKKFILIVVLIFAILILSVFGIITGLTAAAFSSTPLPLKLPKISNEQMLDTFGKMPDIRNILENARPGDVQTIVFDQDDVNTLIVCALNTNDVLNKKKPRDYTVEFKNGKFIITYTKKLDVKTPFGSWVNAKAEVVPDLTEKGQNVIIKGAQLGNLSVPVSLVEDRVNNLMGGVKSSRKFKKFMEIMAELRVDKDNNLVISFRPMKLRKLLPPNFDTQNLSQDLFKELMK